MKKIAVFPGSFDPITLAHVDIVKRGLALFDKIIIGIGVNTTKNSRFAQEDRLEMAKVCFAAYGDRVEVLRMDGLTVDFCQKKGAGFILRGIRNTSDFEFEKAIAQNNKELAPSVQTVFLISEGSQAHISSSIVREILANGGEVSHLIPEAVQKFLK